MIRTSQLIISATVLILLTMGEIRSSPIAYTLRNFPGIPVHVVTVDLSSPSVTVEAQVTAGGPGSTESFRSMLRRTRPVAAITGAFFDTRTKFPVGDIAIGGQVVHRGMIGNGICVTDDGKVEFVDRHVGVANGWKGYSTVICGGPTLLRNGAIVLNPYGEGFRDSSLMGERRRTAVGLTHNNKLLLVSINKSVSLRRLALIMEALNCKDAITLDGGSSAGLWYNGRIFSTPQRELTNLLAVHYIKTPEPYIASTPSVTITE